ncbi:MAG: helix-turn-helix domain-containing protein [Gammaproteobacteria bacterium]|nr:helix-turn-helix domain-containing protein [Gammaproteobacteria bacterium]
MNTDTAIVLVERKFDSFEEFSELAVAWNADFRQLDAECSKSNMFQAKIGALLLSSACLGCHVEQRGETPNGMRTFAIPNIGSSEMNWFGRLVCDESLLLFPRHGEIDVYSRPGFSVLTFSVPEALLYAYLAERGIHNPDNVLGQNEIILRLPARLLQKLRHLLKQAPAIAKRASAFPILVGEFQDEVLSIILQAFANHQPEKFAPWQKSHGKLARTLDYVRTNADTPLRIVDLQRVSKLSERSLQILFKRELGVKPKSYLTGHRLYSVHRELLRSSASNTRVADVANNWGFWHMGHFAADYQKIFGELPSATLKRFL